jgi:hypothetical protein
MMDFLDPKKSRAYTIRLITGYVLISVALVLATTVLLYLASGFNLKKGKIIQNGLVFVSSNPGGAAIYLNDKQQDSQTNARITLQAGTYKMRLARDGYRDWQRVMTVEGGSVEHFDYPLLIPKNLQTVTAGSYPSAPLLTTQSPDRRWLLAQVAGRGTGFDVYDLKDPDTIAQHKTTITVPTSLLTLSQPGDQTFQLAEWARNNMHVLLKHVVGDKFEYILLSREKPEESVNLTKQLQLSASMEITLQDKKFDRYFVHDHADQKLSTATIQDVTLKPLLTGVVQYKTYGDDVILYATAEGASADNMYVKLYQDGKSYPIRQIARQDDAKVFVGATSNQASAPYLLDVTNYDNKWYVALGSPSEDHVYVYRNAVDRLRQNPSDPLAPVEILKLSAPNYMEFSANSQFLMIENDRDIAVFDAENERSFNYKLDRPIEAPQAHAIWMDGFRLQFVSEGSATIVDYDGTNVQTLIAGGAKYIPIFDTAYKTMYALVPASSADKTADTAAKQPAPASGTTTGTADSWQFIQASLRTGRDQ